MPDEQTEKIENTGGDYSYSDPDIVETTYNFQKILDTHFIQRMETSDEKGVVTANDSALRCRRKSDSNEGDSELVVVSVLLNKKQKENDEVAMAIDRLRKNGVNCVCFTMNDIRNGNLKSDTKVAEALQSPSLVTQSGESLFTAPGLKKLTPRVTTTTTSAQVSEITSTLTTPTFSDINVPKRILNCQVSPDITTISSSSSAVRVTQSCRAKSPEITAFHVESSVSSTPTLTREWHEPLPKTVEVLRSCSSTPPPPVLSPQVEPENVDVIVEPISEPTVSSCEQVDENQVKQKRKKRKRRRQSFFYRPASKKKKMCPFAKAVVKGTINFKKELEETTASTLSSLEILPTPTLNINVVNENAKVINEESKAAKTKVNTEEKYDSFGIKNEPPSVEMDFNSVAEGVKQMRRSSIKRSAAVSVQQSKEQDDSKTELETLLPVKQDIADIVKRRRKVQIKEEPIVPVVEKSVKVFQKPTVTKVKVARKAKVKAKKSRNGSKSKKKVVKPIKIKLNGFLRAFSPDITLESPTQHMAVDCVQLISGKLDVQDDDKSIEDVQLKVDEIVKALELESEDSVGPVDIFSAIEDGPIQISTNNAQLSEPLVQTPTIVNIKQEELEDQKLTMETITKSDSIPDSPDAMQLRRSSFYSLISGNVRTNLEKYMDGRVASNKSFKRRKRVKNGFLLHHGDNYPDDPESPYKLHLATQVLLKLNKRRAKFKPKDDRGKSLLSYLKLVPKRSMRLGKVPAKPQEEKVPETEPLFSGEWSLPRKFVCNICAHEEDCFWDLVTHKGENHPGVLATHVELTHATPPGLIRSPTENSTPNYPPPPCTKCSQKFSNFPDLHRHIFECAGNAAWLEEKLPRKKKAKRRRGFKRRLSNTPKKATGKKSETTAKRRHSEVFKCEFCTREFKTEGWLKNHLVTHSLPVSIPLEKLSPPSRASLTSYRHVNVSK